MYTYVRTHSAFACMYLNTCIIPSAPNVVSCFSYHKLYNIEYTSDKHLLENFCFIPLGFLSRNEIAELCVS